MQIIVGLGNPGEKYANTRHNAGFMALDYLARQKGLDWEYSKKFNANIARQSDIIFFKPLTFMNLSGQPIACFLRYYKLLPKTLGIISKTDADLSETLTVIHDDLDIEIGKYKISLDSRSAGHNGVQSVIDCLKTQNFKRMRIGIKNSENEKSKGIGYVLGKFLPAELVLVEKTIKDIESHLIKNYKQT